MKRSCCALVDDKSVASNLVSIQFLTSLADKFPMDIKRQWAKDSLKITEESGRLPSFRGLTAFAEAQTKISHFVFGLRLFLRGRSKKLNLLKGLKASAFSTNISNTTRNVSKKARLSLIARQYCSGSHFIYQCRNSRTLPYLEKWDADNILRL